MRSLDSIPLLSALSALSAPALFCMSVQSTLRCFFLFIARAIDLGFFVFGTVFVVEGKTSMCNNENMNAAIETLGMHDNLNNNSYLPLSSTSIDVADETADLGAPESEVSVVGVAVSVAVVVVSGEGGDVLSALGEEVSADSSAGV